MKKSYKWLPVIDEDLCTGCGACVEACGPRCLDMPGGVAVLSRPHVCGSEEHCIAPCPEACIWMAWVPLEGEHAVGRWKVVDEETAQIQELSGMKRIGLIGGLSPESTVHYYEYLCREYNRRFGGLNFPEITLQSLNLQNLVRFYEKNDWDAVAVILLDALTCLKRAGADFAAILANTPHNSYEKIRDTSPLEILTIMDATVAALRRDARQTVALLGTRATTEVGFFQKHFQSQDLEVLVPESSQRCELDRIIWEELAHGTIRPESASAARTMIEGLAARGADAVILGCTELSLLIKPGDSSVPLYDTTRIHAEAILEFALRPEPSLMEVGIER